MLGESTTENRPDVADAAAARHGTGTRPVAGYAAAVGRRAVLNDAGRAVPAGGSGGVGGRRRDEVRAYVAPVRAAAGPDLPVEEALLLMRAEGGGRDAALAVMEGGHLVGVVTRAELEAAARARGGAGGRAGLAEAAGLRVVYCFADSDVADAAATMRAARVSHLAVLGEDVRLLGLLARRDLPPTAAAVPGPSA